MTRPNRNNTIDLCKFVGAIFVICAHTYFLCGVLGKTWYLLANAVYRLALPFFALTTGYYTSILLDTGARSKRQVMSKQWLRVLKVYAVWTVLYFVYTCLRTPGSSPIDLLGGYMNNTLVYGAHYHLWYILALLVALPVFAVSWSQKRWKILAVVAVGCYALHSWINIYSKLFACFVPDVVAQVYDNYTSLINGILVIFPLLVMGGVLRMVKVSVKNKYMWLLFAILLMLTALEGYWLMLNGVKSSGFTISRLMVSLCLFLCLIKKGNTLAGSSLVPLLSASSLVIYYVHPMIVESLQDHLHSSVSLFFVSAVLSVAVSMGWLALKRYLAAYKTK